MHLISIVNNKGGVGKTTLVQNIAVGLTYLGYRVGMIDFDPQANLSLTVKNDLKNNVRDILSSGKSITIDSFNKTERKNLYIIPNKKDINSKLFSDITFFDDKRILRDKIHNMQNTDELDYILIDTPANLELQTINSLVASDYVIIPIKYDVFSIDGLVTVKQYIDKIKEYVNPDLQVLGIVATHVNDSESINKVAKKEIESLFPGKLFHSRIKVSTKIKQSQLKKTDVYTLPDPRSIFDFNNLIYDLLDRIK